MQNVLVACVCLLPLAHSRYQVPRLTATLEKGKARLQEQTGLSRSAGVIKQPFYFWQDEEGPTEDGL